MAPELVFICVTAASLLSVTWAASRSREWVTAAVLVLVALTTLVSGRFVSLFGLTCSLGSALYAGVYLGIDVLNEFFRPVDARRCVQYSLFGNGLVLVVGWLGAQAPLYGTGLDAAVAEVLAALPRIVGAGLVAFAFGARVEIELYARLRRRTKDLPGGLALRSNLSTWAAQLVDAALFFSLAFYGTLANERLLELVLSGWLLRIVVALADTPLLYLVKGLKKG